MASKKPHWSRKLVALRACPEAAMWARRQPSLAVAWRKCERPDWMGWLLNMQGADTATCYDPCCFDGDADAIRKIYPTITSTGIRL